MFVVSSKQALRSHITSILQMKRHNPVKCTCKYEYLHNQNNCFIKYTIDKKISSFVFIFALFSHQIISRPVVLGFAGHPYKQMYSKWKRILLKRRSFDEPNCD